MIEKYGDAEGLFKTLGARSRDEFEAVRWLTVKLANDGELCRRAQGLSPLPLLTEEEISPRMRPIDYMELKNAVVAAVNLGYQREEDDADEELDVGLAEIRQKKQG